MTIKHICLRTMVISVCILGFGSAWGQSDLNEAIASLSASMSEKIRATGKKKIAVANFTNTQGDETALGKFIAEEFSVELAIIANGFSVVDRSRVSFLLKENGLTVSGLVDPKAAIELGKLSSIDALVVGTMTPFGENLRLNVKVLDLQTADIVTAVRGQLARTNTIDELRTTQLKKTVSPATNKSSGTQKSKNTPISAQQGGSGGRSLTANGLAFTLDKCEKKKNIIDCIVVIKAVGHDNIFTIYGNYGVTKSVAYDDKGAAKVASVVDVGGTRNNRIVKRTLVANVANKVKLQFKGLSTAAEKVALLQIKYHSSANNQSDVLEFRDIALLGM